MRRKGRGKKIENYRGQRREEKGREAGRRGIGEGREKRETKVNGNRGNKEKKEEEEQGVRRRENWE